ncbi:uncharacterized protein LOC131014004 [Salvia miltiorrhiza]|uniref:uncharacterized protein LOC131014004 n=1 Tax=Salvia miltiorrhiza TaxID=226208 RepID=UPI0025ACEA8E|nr:uncharacterized protein LOC131014004 [Salvia miltiorrhiza]
MSSSPKMDVSGGPCKTLAILFVVFYFIFVAFSNQYPNCPASADFFSPFLKRQPFSPSTEKETQSSATPTTLEHLVFGLVGSERAWHHRKAYIESWWRPNVTRGFLFLDTAPTGDLLPWSPASPPYRISDDITKLLHKTNVVAQRIIHAIMEVYREDHENLRWLVMGDDDSIFVVDNIVHILAGYDHTKYYYFGGQSEFILSNYWFSFSQGFGGAGFIMSYPLAKLVAADMEKCLLRYRHLNAADRTTMSCIADIGVNLTPLKGIHQIDLRGDISGFLSSHPKYPLMSLHHFDMVQPIFPKMNRPDSTRHLMKAVAADNSRMLQQTICYHRPTNWSFSIAWGYSAHIYENILPRSHLQYPIETFKTWQRSPRPPHYMFNTRLPSRDPCEAPHMFFYHTVGTTADDQILTEFSRAWGRGLPACPFSGNHSADSISRIQVFSPATKRFQIDRSECCDVVRVDGEEAEIKFRECAAQEIIA